jgi:hypothetical protein
MNRSTKLYSLFSPGFGASRARIIVNVVALVAAGAIGCAAPKDPATNVVAEVDARACSSDSLDSLGSLDVAIVIDTSQSTRRPSGVDIDQDGRIYTFDRSHAVHHGDTWLAAQIAAVRPLIRNAEGRDIRFSIVTFAGSTIPRTVGGSQLVGSIRDSKMRAALTSDTRELESVLNEVFEAGSDGKTIFSAGMNRATRSLIAPRSDRRRRIVLLMSDSSRPNSVDTAGDIKELDPRMKNAAVVAQLHEVVFHTFGLSKESRSWRGRPLGQIAGATGGTYHPVEDPRQLYCHLVSALPPSYRLEQRGWQDAFAKYRKQQAR